MVEIEKLPTTTPDQARLALESLVADYYRYDARAREIQSEANVRANFIDRLFSEVLGWPINNPAHYNREQYVRRAGFADIALSVNPSAGPVLFVEAKRFGAIEALHRVQAAREAAGGPLHLAGMSVDRTREEQQAINYAYEKGIRWAVLTNFERLRLFDALRDTLVLSFETPRDLQDQFEALWYLSFEEVRRGRLAELRAHRERADIDAEYLNLINLWRLRLGQDIYSRKGNRPLLTDPTTGKADVEKLRAAVQRILDRLVVIRYAEDRLVIEPDQLYQLVQTTRQVRYLSLLALIREFFLGFNVQHDGTLFADHLCDRLELGQEILSAVIDNLYDARFRAMSPDIMGNTYEQYLGQTLIIEQGEVRATDNVATRKKQGSYYTPEYIVHYIVDHTLGRYLYATENGRPDGTPLPDATPKTLAEIDGSQGRPLKVLDPASGSGSFLIYAYQVLEEFYRRELARLQAEHDARAAALLKERHTQMEIHIALAELEHRLETLQDYRNQILERHLYGVDLDPQAAELAAVNLMLRALKRGWRLPLILNQNIKVGNSLIGGAPVQPPAAGEADPLAPYAPQLATLRRLRLEQQGLAANGESVEGLQARIDTLSAELNVALNIPLSAWFDDIAARRPFNWVVEFPEVFLDEQGHWLPEPGFDIVVGNPPYIRPHKLESAIKQILWKRFDTYRAKSDILNCFIQLGIEIIRPGGWVGYITANTWHVLSSSRELRAYVLSHTRVNTIGLLPKKVFHDATINVVITLLQREPVETLRLSNIISVCDVPHALTLTHHAQSVFVRNKDFIFFTRSAKLLEILRQVRESGCPLGTIASVDFGLKTAHDAAFIKQRQNSPEDKKLLSSKDIHRYFFTWAGDYVWYVPELMREQHTTARPGDSQRFEQDKLIISRMAAQLSVALDRENFYVKDALLICPRPDQPYALAYLAALLNSKLLNVYYNSIFTTIDLHRNELINLPIKAIDFTNPEEVALHTTLTSLAQTMLDLHQLRQTVTAVFADCLAAREHVSRPFYQAYANHDQYRERSLLRVGLADANARGVVTAVRVAEAETTLEIYVTQEETAEQRLIGWHIPQADLRQFLLLALRLYLETNARKQIWAQGLLVRGTLEALQVPVLDETTAAGNLMEIAALMAEVRARVQAQVQATLGERAAALPDPLALGALETALAATDARIDALVYALYGIIDPEDIALIETAIQ